MTSASEPIRIFRAGTFTSLEGTKVSFAAADLVAIAAAYDADADPAPLVIGHPKTDDPAYGWVGSLAVDGDMLVATPSRVVPSFAETVREGSYAKVSAQFYPPGHPASPNPDGYYLKHVGFLGAHAPGVKGLGTVSLADGDGDPLVTIDFTPAQEKIVPEPKKDGELSFAEQKTALDEREATLDAREKALAKTARDDRHKDHVSFAESMVAAATLAPAGKGLLVGLLDQLGDAVDVVSFGETEADKMTPVAAMKKLLGGAKPLVSLGEAAGADKLAPGEVDPAEVARQAQSFAEAEAKEGRTVTIAAAVRHVMKKEA